MTPARHPAPSPAPRTFARTPIIDAPSWSQTPALAALDRGQRLRLVIDMAGKHPELTDLNEPGYIAAASALLDRRRAEMAAVACPPPPNTTEIAE
ncbi:MAG TPA: hypothetical protein PKC43_06595 [Phycisphaerales bacterium]|nr:hypothetical protein [Phycisphaerales bacterium]HMP37100.1 hypothetical protein [Phycisphaerales bacterium]